MSDFYDILMAQPEEEAKDIALSLELFVNGSLNIFNHQTNVDVDNRFTVYGIRDLQDNSDIAVPSVALCTVPMSASYENSLKTLPLSNEGTAPL